ncbi:MAG: hypothetical protein ABIF82_13965 [Planctomycetota bacterium]
MPTSGANGGFETCSHVSAPYNIGITGTRTSQSRSVEPYCVSDARIPRPSRSTRV